jgi:diguanylate cyclase (GGDEF)-like protein
VSQVDDAHRQVSNTLVRVALEYAEAVIGPGTTARILSLAGEDRPPEVVVDDAGWISYDQFRRLLEVTVAVLGGAGDLSHVHESADISSGTMPSVTEMQQLMGSPHALFEDVANDRNPVVRFCETEGEQTGPSEWLIRTSFKVGYAPFAEFCALNAGLYHMLPWLFGYTETTVVEETCVHRGDDRCQLRIAWDATDPATQQQVALEQRISVLERRLEQFQATVADLVLAVDLDTALERVTSSFAQLVRAPGFVLAIEPIPGLRRCVYAHGLGQAEAERVGALVLAGEPCPEVGDRITDITSSRHHYGRLAIYKAEGSNYDDTGMLAAYARLAATALDSATAIEETRREAARGRALLELSATLADITTVEAMARSLARATPAVTGADRAVVSMADWKRGTSCIIACHGFTPEDAARMNGAEIPITGPATSEISYPDQAVLDASGLDADLRAEASVCVVPIGVDGEIAGWLTAAVVGDPARLAPSPDLEARLRGLAAQASSALRNAHLVEQSRHQALHDPLTGLPNRALILDRADQMLARSHRDLTPVSALFLDLDGFKQVNDTLGHDAGDKLLQAVATRLNSVVRQCDTLARLGGDEFVVLVNGADSATGPVNVAQRLLHVMRKPFILEGRIDQPLHITASIGIATAGQDSSSGDLLRHADVALYQAKANGRDRSAVHRPGMEDDESPPLQPKAGTVTTLETHLYWDPFDTEIDASPHGVWRRLRDEQPVYRNERHDFWALSRYADIEAAFKDPGTFSSSQGTVLEIMGADMGTSASVIFMDPPAHTALRALVSRAFTPRRIGGLEERIRERCRLLLDPHVGTGGFDYIGDFGGQLPSLVISALLGVPDDEREEQRRNIDEIFHIEPGVGMVNDTSFNAQIRLYGYLDGLVGRRMADPKDDLVSALGQAEIADASGAPRRLTPEEVVSFSLLLFSAGTETVGRLLGNAAVVLAQHPDQRAELAADPTLIPNAIEELLRYEAPSPVNGRVTTRDVTLHGVTIPAGSKVLLINGSATRDEREYPDPDRFDIHRDIRRHLSFGYGIHFCVGAALARLEGRVALEETLLRFPTWELDPARVVRQHTSTVRGYSKVGIVTG